MIHFSAERRFGAILVALLWSLACSSSSNAPGGSSTSGVAGATETSGSSSSSGAAGHVDSASAGAPSAGAEVTGGRGGAEASGGSGVRPTAGAAGASGGTENQTQAGGGAGGALSGASSVAGGAASGGQAGADAPIVQDDFTNGLGLWSSELESGGTVSAANGVLDVDVPAGATIWLKQQLSDPVAISYTATAISASGPNDHVTDLNAFWNARDTRSPNDLFATKRTGAFADYDLMNLYYVGFGGNLNTTTRMRRYVGEAGNRPLLFDSMTPLLVANHTYRVQLIADGKKVQYWSDGSLLFDYTDASPYTSGWFGFRTTGSHFHFAQFAVRRSP